MTSKSLRAEGLSSTEIEISLWKDLLDRWFPACVIPEGGFHQTFALDWAKSPDPYKGIIYQSRMTWVCSTVAELEHPKAAEFRKYAQHGVDYLLSHFLVEETGAVKWSVDTDGNPIGPFGSEYHAYGCAFAIYALAAAARAIKSDKALSAAQKVFEWLEDKHVDPEFGGYYEAVSRDGSPVITSPTPDQTHDAIETVYGQKSQNTHLHLLEAYAELYRVWPDPKLEGRLLELLNRFSDVFYVAPGWLHCFVERDWTPVAGDLSFGHDIEATHLMLDAANLVGLGEDQHVFERAKSLVDFALEHGFDEDNGGFFVQGKPHGDVTNPLKNWWVEAEGLLALATLWKRTGDDKYQRAMNLTWAWIRDHQIDPVHGGWFEDLSPAGGVMPGTGKGHAWKAAYHDGRSLIFTQRILKSLGR